MKRLGMALSATAGVMAGYLAGRRRTSAGSREQSGQEETHLPQQRIVHIARIRQGNEADVRRLITGRFPRAALQSTGIREVTMYVGSGYCVTAYGYSGEFAQVFATFRSEPAIAEFLQELGQLLDEEPAPFPVEPGGQYLAAQAVYWSLGGITEFSPHRNVATGSTEFTEAS